MPLRWSIEDCEDWQELTKDNEWSITHALIWATMAIGMNRITKRNAGEFFARVDTLQRATGNLVTIDTAIADESHPDKWVPYLISEEDIFRRVGLGTNADSLTKARFFKHIENISEWNARKIKSSYETALGSVTISA